MVTVESNFYEIERIICKCQERQWPNRGANSRTKYLEKIIWRRNRKGTRVFRIPFPDKILGAHDWTRTSTPVKAPAPEAGASTNFATWARTQDFTQTNPIVKYKPIR